MDAMFAGEGASGNRVNHLCLAMSSADSLALRARLAGAGVAISTPIQNSYGAGARPPRRSPFPTPTATCSKRAAPTNLGQMSSKPPGDPKEPAVEATLDDLRPVDTHPLLRPVSATLTLDEDLPAPSATQRLDPIAEAPTDLQVHVPVVLGESRDAAPRKRVSIKADAFESSPGLGAAPLKGEVVARGPPPAWQKRSVWTPGLIVLTLTGVAMLLVGMFLILQRWG